jgi:hypothetical protein
VQNVLRMASKTNNLLTFYEFETADSTNLALLWKIQMYIHVCQIVTEPFKQSISNDRSLRVNWFLLCILLSMMILRFFDDGLKLDVVFKFLCSILFMQLRLFNVINVIKADDIIFKLFIVTEFNAFITTHRQNWENKKQWHPYHEKYHVLQEVDKQNWDQMAFFESNNLFNCLDCCNEVHRLYKLLGIHHLLLPPNCGNCVAKYCSFHGPFNESWPFKPLVSAEPSAAAPAH